MFKKFGPKIASREIAVKELLAKMIPGIVIAVVAFILLTRSETSNSSNSDFTGLYVLMAYMMFCIPWVLFIIKDSINESIRASAIANHRGPKNNGAYFISSVKSMMLIMLMVLASFTIVPYRVIRAIVFLFKKQPVPVVVEE